jgi:hypothetical protein
MVKISLQKCFGTILLAKMELNQIVINLLCLQLKNMKYFGHGKLKTRLVKTSSKIDVKFGAVVCRYPSFK